MHISLDLQKRHVSHNKKLKSWWRHSYEPSLCMANPTSSKVKFIFSNDAVFSSLTLPPTSCSCKISYCTKIRISEYDERKSDSRDVSKRVVSSLGNKEIFHNKLLRLGWQVE